MTEKKVLSRKVIHGNDRGVFLYQEAYTIQEDGRHGGPLKSEKGRQK